MAILSRVHHANLVELLGFCQEDGKSMLVYEYMHNGNLEEHLFGNVDFVTSAELNGYCSTTHKPFLRRKGKNPDNDMDAEALDC